MNRKDFIRSSTMAAFAITTMGCAIKRTEVSAEAPASTHTGDCATTNDILGPFYRPDAPDQSDMIIEGLKGAHVAIKGNVYTDDCTTPLDNVKVEIWHCDTKGDYDNDSDQYKHRAQQTSDATGSYGFQTILPGKYLNGKLFRPAHIHFRVSHVDHQELISQIYFAGDPHITEDPWASQEKAQARILPIILEDTQGNLAVQFDIFLNKIS
jgi:protocatechuate 3,4-dioxygenase beta subunit